MDTIVGALVNSLVFSFAIAVTVIALFAAFIVKDPVNGKHRIRYLLVAFVVLELAGSLYSRYRFENISSAEEPSAGTSLELLTQETELEYGDTVFLTQLAYTQNHDDLNLEVTEIEPADAAITYDDTCISFFTLGEYVVHIEAEDASGNVASALAKVSVVDTTAPVFIGADETCEVACGKTMRISDSAGGTNKLYARAEDEASEAEVIISSVATEADELPEGAYKLDETGKSISFEVPGVYLLTLCARDAWDNYADAEKTTVVTAVDATAPEITGLISAWSLTEDDEAPDFLLDAVAADAVDGDLSAGLSVDDSQVQYGIPGTYMAYCTVSDAAGNEASSEISVEIKDTKAPVITLSQSAWEITAGDSLPDFAVAATVTDAVDGDLSSALTVDASNVDTNNPGTYEITFSVSDTSGNTATEKASVTVHEQTQQGADSASESASTSSQEEIVYITKTGKKYHRSGCRHLSKSKIEISKSEAIARGYTPCKTCNPG